MGYRVVRFEETPNPNAVKAVLDRSPGQSPRAYRSAEAAQADPLGATLMALPGVTNILIHDGWISVGKSGSTAWRDLKRAIEKALAETDG